MTITESAFHTQELVLKPDRTSVAFAQVTRRAVIDGHALKNWTYRNVSGRPLEPRRQNNGTCVASRQQHTQDPENIFSSHLGYRNNGLDQFM